MCNELPEQFDLIVIGTGFTESCIAAAASRVGKTVLHVDANEFYGGAWTSFNLEALNELLDKNASVEIQNGSYKWHESSSAGTIFTDNVTTEDWTQAKLREKSRAFSLDLCPKILYAVGDLVKLLIKSNICRYAEFRAVDHVCTRYQGEVINVPCSRSDVFNTKDLNIIEKRLLMKFLNSCMTFGSAEEKCDEDMLAYRGKTFAEYLRAQRVTDKIATCVMQAIAMCNEQTSFEEGMQRTQQFLQSLGRYGNTPFIYPMYGCGELPQCFCRLCAVFGGIYCLKWRIDQLSVDPTTKEVLLHSANAAKTLRAKHLVCSHGNVPDGSSDLVSNGTLIGYNAAVQPQLSRGIYIGTQPIGAKELNTGGGGVNLLRLLSADGQHEAILIQLSHYSGTCPKGTFVYHLTTPALSNNPSVDLAPFEAQVFPGILQSLLFSAYFSIMAPMPPAPSNANCNALMYCTAAPYYELDYDRSIKNARDIFAQLYPTAEFLPRAPDPEEIVVDGEDPLALNEHSLPEDLRAQLHTLEANVQKMDMEEDEQQMEAE